MLPKGTIIQDKYDLTYFGFIYDVSSFNYVISHNDHYSPLLSIPFKSFDCNKITDIFCV